MNGIEKFAFVEARDQDSNRRQIPIDDILDVADLGSGSGRCKLTRRSIGPQQSTESYDTVISRIGQRWDQLRAAIANPQYRIAAYADGSSYSFTTSSAALTFGLSNPAVIIAQAGTYLIRGRVHVYYNGATFAAVRDLELKYRRTNNTAADLADGSTIVYCEIATTRTGTFVVVEMPEVVYTTDNLDDNVAIYGQVSALPSAGSLDAIEAHIIAQRVE